MCIEGLIGATVLASGALALGVVNLRLARKQRIEARKERIKPMTAPMNGASLTEVAKPQ